MTRATFYKKLRKVAPKFQWKITKAKNYDDTDLLRAYKKVKGKRVEFCPLTAVAYAERGTVMGVGDYDFAAELLEINYNDRELIVKSADNCYLTEDDDKIDPQQLAALREVRRTLVRSAGLPFS